MLLDAAEAGALDPLLRGLLPGQVHVRGVERFSALVRHLVEEAAEARPGRDLVLARLVDILLVEALRLAPPASAPAGLLRGLADARLARALGQIHAAPARPWTLATLAREAALSRSAFFERFTRQVGLSPLAYLLAWRMALARRLLRQGNRSLGAVAAAVGYASASTFSTAFRRHTGQPPGRYARAWAAAAQAGASQSARATDIGMAEEKWRAREDSNP